jgi:hypothetical protein
MSHRPCLSLAVLLALFVSPSLYAQHGGGASYGGGHFGGSFGGHSFSGHSVGHAVGHSFGHIFGHRSGGRGSRLGKVPRGDGDEPPIAGAAFIHGKVVALPGPAGATVNYQPTHPMPPRFIAGPMPRAIFPRNGLFDSGFCASFGFSWHNFLFPGDFDCFGDPFLFDPFFSGGFIGVHFRSDSFITSGSFGVFPGSVASPAIAEPAGASPVTNGTAPRRDIESSGASPLDTEEPVTLLQLRDGTMYGLTRYWVEGGLLHYVTDYGGQNSVPFDRIDLAKTTELNAARGSPFVLPDSLVP